MTNSTETDTIICIRLKPYNPKAQCVMRDYTAPWGFKYVAGVWYEQTDPRYGDYLKTVRQRPDVDGSPPAFDVLTKAQAEHVILMEEAAKQGKLVNPAARDTVDAPRDPIKVSASKSLNRPNPTHELTRKGSAAAEVEAEDGEPDPGGFFSKPATVKKSTLGQKPAQNRRGRGARSDA